MDIRATPSSSRPVSLAALLIISSAAAILCLPGAAAQGPPAENPTAPVTSNPGAEPPSASVKIKANLVIVPVVVRDSSGHAVGSLHREDFLLFDNRKSQGITQFAIEKSEQADSGSTAAGAAKTNKRFIAPDRFTAILFDDLHSTFGNLPQLQAASLQLVSGALARTERLGIFTTSGKITVEFTNDRNKLQDAIRRLKPNPLPGSRGDTCPDISYFDANQIVNRGDTSTSDAAVGQIMAQCGVKDPKLAAAMVREASERI